MPVGTYVRRQMRSVRREGNRLTDHFLALRRVPSSANLDHLSDRRELPQSNSHGRSSSFAAAVALPCIACHVRERLFSRPNADTFVRRRPPPHYDTFGFIFACCWCFARIGPWIWSACVVEPFQKKVPVANTTSTNRPSSDGKRDDGKSAPFIQFTWLRCGGVRGQQQLGNKRLALRSLKMCVCVCSYVWRNSARRLSLTYISEIINSSRLCVETDPTARLPLIPHLDPAPSAICCPKGTKTSLTPVLTSSPRPTLRG